MDSPARVHWLQSVVDQVRLPDRVAWDARLSDAVQRAAGVPVSVELQSTAEERLA